MKYGRMSLIMTSMTGKNASFICSWFQRVDKQFTQVGFDVRPVEHLPIVPDSQHLRETRKEADVFALNCMELERPKFPPRTPPLVSWRHFRAMQSVSSHRVRPL